MTSIPETPDENTPDALISKKLQFIINEGRDLRRILNERPYKLALMCSVDSVLHDLTYIKGRLKELQGKKK